jgi:hypothetical protein
VRSRRAPVKRPAIRPLLLVVDSAASCDFLAGIACQCNTLAMRRAGCLADSAVALTNNGNGLE